ncbi:MAG: hypothetical protein ACHQM6_03275 [Candidatus Kapaibacterium sp.]
MKKYILMISLCISASSFAQEKLILGFDAGSLVAGEHRTYATSGLSYSLQPDYLFGIEAGYGFSEQFALRMQIFIEQRTISAQRSFETFDSAISQISTGTYGDGGGSNTFFEIPLTAKYNFFSGRSHAYIFAGPVVGLAIESGKANFCITAGAGYSRDLTHIITFFAETGYMFGFANLSGENYYYKTFARDFRVNAGLLFNIGLPLEVDY